MATIQVPNFEFGAFYYPQLFVALMNYRRANVPELTDESDSEASVQLLKSFALVGHLNNCLIDMMAHEATLPTAQLPETIRNMLRLIAYELKPATPSGTDIMYKLSRVFTTTFELVPELAQASTEQDGETPPIYFEASEAITIDRTDRVGAVFLEVGGVFSSKTSEAVLGTPFDANLPNANDKLYIGHSSIMWDAMSFALTVASPVLIGVWEFYDGDFNDTQPSTVINLGGSLMVELTSLLGPLNRAGATVRIRLNSSGAYEDVVSSWNGSINVGYTTSLLGQSSVSTTASDYTIGVEWKEIPSLTDETEQLTTAGQISFPVPQTESLDWKKTTINSFSGYFLRFRVVQTVIGAGPTLGLVRIDVGKQYALAPAIQGRTTIAETLGSSNGEADQRFASAHDGFILASEEVRVDDEVWTRVDNFLNSASQDKHYTIELGENDRATVVFGNGSTGRIPPIGQGNVVIDYRFGADADGNVGANTITIDKQGLTFIESITNPRPAGGWAAAESSSTESLERAKIAGPASLRVKSVALSADDLEDLTPDFIDADGTSPFSRAKAVEEGFGPKTVELVCVARGGRVPTPTQLSNFQTYLNGDKTAIPPVRKHFVANQQVVCTAFEARSIDVTATVHAPADVVAEQVKNKLSALLQPEALDTDGVTYVWEFGGLVPYSRISHEIFNTDTRVRKVILSSEVDIQLGPRQLPTTGTLTIVMVSTS